MSRISYNWKWCRGHCGVVRTAVLTELPPWSRRKSGLCVLTSMCKSVCVSKEMPSMAGPCRTHSSGHHFLPLGATLTLSMTTVEGTIKSWCVDVWSTCTADARTDCLNRRDSSSFACPCALCVTACQAGPCYATFSLIWLVFWPTRWPHIFFVTLTKIHNFSVLLTNTC